MTSEWIKEIDNFPKEYKEIMSGKLSKRQLEILEGSPLRSNEGIGSLFYNVKF